MVIQAKIKSLQFREFLKLAKIFILCPQLIIPCLKATRETIAICNKEFGNEHHKNKPANAFRHALWNYKICENCSKNRGEVRQAIEFSKKITDLHEVFAPNPPLEKLMDLHNNQIGRRVFKENREFSINAVSVFKKMMKEAVPISKAPEINKAGNHLVFIEE